jgi:hypothetical protein
MKKTVLFAFVCLFAIGCANGSGMKVIIKPAFDKRLKEAQQMPLHAGLFIEPSLRQFRQEERQNDLVAGIHHYIFPIGEPLASSIEKMTKSIFRKVTILSAVPERETVEKEGMDAVLTVRMKSSRLELTIEDSVWRAMGKHFLSLQVSFSDRNLNPLFEGDMAVEGKNVDVIDFETEGGWWKIAGPKYGPSVEDAIEKITYALAMKLIACKDKIIAQHSRTQ